MEKGMLIFPEFVQALNSRALLKAAGALRWLLPVVPLLLWSVMLAALLPAFLQPASAQSPPHLLEEFLKSKPLSPQYSVTVSLTPSHL